MVYGIPARFLRNGRKQFLFQSLKQIKIVANQNTTVQLMLFYEGTNIMSTKDCIQEALKKLTYWVHNIGFKFLKSESEYIIFFFVSAEHAQVM